LRERESKMERETERLEREVAGGGREPASP